jgi:uncharacterized membrane protein (DUF485 family)
MSKAPQSSGVARHHAAPRIRKKRPDLRSLLKNGDVSTGTQLSLAAVVDAGEQHFHDGTEFQELRRRYRRFVFPVTAAALGWFLLYVLCSMYAPGLMRVHVTDEISLAFLFGLSQFVVTFAVTYLYCRHADRRLEPLAHEIRVNMLEVGQ